MQGLFFSLLHYFLTPIGLFVLGILDASVVFYLPLGIDVVVILMAARTPHLFWLYAILAACGSATGAGGTFWLGREAGEHGLTRFVSSSRLKSIRHHIDRGAAVVGALAIIPPPFPFTAFVLSGGALGLRARAFFPALVTARLIQYGVEGGLAAIYGRAIVHWMRTPTFKAVVSCIIALAIIGTIVSAIAVFKTTQKSVA